MIRTGWDIIEDYYLIPPGELVAETIAMVQDLGNEIARTWRNVDANRPLPMRKLWIDTKTGLSILMSHFARNILYQSGCKVNTVKTVLLNKQII